MKTGQAAERQLFTCVNYSQARPGLVITYRSVAVQVVPRIGLGIQRRVLPVPVSAVAVLPALVVMGQPVCCPKLPYARPAVAVLKTVAVVELSSRLGPVCWLGPWLFFYLLHPLSQLCQFSQRPKHCQYFDGSSQLGLLIFTV